MRSPGCIVCGVAPGPRPPCSRDLSALLRQPLLSLTLSAALCAQAAAAEWPAALTEMGKQQITRAALEAPIRFLSSDALEGRGPGSRGDELARLYLATELEALGFEPGGANGKWQQPFDIVGIKAHMPPVWSFTGPHGPVDLKWRDDYIAASGQQREQVSVTDASLVFVGYGIQAPEYHWDDFKGMDVRGKILVMLNNDPDWDPKLFAGKRRLYYGRWVYKYEMAARQGAAGAIIVHTTPSAGYPWQVVQSSWGGTQFELPAENEPRTQVNAWATEQAVRELLKAAGQDADKLFKAARSRSFQPVPLKLHTSLSFTNELSRAQTANVAGLLRGADDQHGADEVLVYSAHHDHFGIGEPDASGDRIYHGARDNASGCAQLLAIARAYAALRSRPQVMRPRRSVLFLFVAGEERGLLGSGYYARHPTFPAGKIAADINYDSGNIFGRSRDLSLISAGKSNVDQYVEQVARAQGRVVKPDQFADRGSYYRSDQFSFAHIGVPAIFVDTGTDFIGHPPDWGRTQIEQWEAQKYHQPGDRLDASWNFDGMIEDAQVGLHAGWLIANADSMPGWNPGDEFEAARRQALAAVK